MSTQPETITARDLSFQQAVAGAAAQQTAQACGADPADMRALRQSVAPAINTIGGKPLHGFSLQVVLDLQMAATVFGGDLLHLLSPVVQNLASSGAAVPTPEELTLISRLGLIFTEPFEAYDLLEDITAAVTEDGRKYRLREFTRGAMRACGEWTAEEIGLFIRHLITLGKSAAPAGAPAS